MHSFTAYFEPYINKEDDELMTKIAAFEAQKSQVKIVQ